MARPYRSHKIPACDACRRRKIRCAQNVQGAPCERCRKLGRSCQSSLGAINGNDTDLAPHLDTTPEAPASAPATTTNTLASRAVRASSASLLVGSEVAEDVEILECYLSSRSLAQERTTPYQTIYSTPQESIGFVSVPRRRPGLNVVLPAAQLEALQRLLGPGHHDELMGLYSRYIHPYFPIVDLEAIAIPEEARDERFSYTLLIYIYVSSLHLAKDPQPDIIYASNLAVSALQSDFMAPSVSTISAAVLDLLGRPVKTVIFNILTAGKLVALAYSHGLHRDPTRWPSPPEPIAQRKRLWWAVLILDHWGSYAHGTPPSISRKRHDVPMVQPEDYAPVQHDPGSRQISGSFTHLCQLSEILGDLLNLVHDLTTDWAGVPKVLRRIECSLDDWETMACQAHDINPSRSVPSGHCSLWLSYLSVKLLVQRLYLRSAASQTTLPPESEKQYRTMSLRASAVAIVEFIISLKRDNFQEFWLSFSANILVSTTIMLLRCTIETRDEVALLHYKAKLISFRNTLETAVSESKWDIAEMCLERCSEAIDRVARVPAPVHNVNAHNDANARHAGSGLAHAQDLPQAREQSFFDPTWLNQPFPDIDLDLPTDSLDFLWEGI